MKLQIGIRLLFASLALVLFSSYDQTLGFVIAGMVMTFPTWKYFRSRLATGAQIDEDEAIKLQLEAIDKVSKQIAGFEKLLGDKADKKEFEAVNKTLKELKEGLDKLSDAKLEEKMTSINEAILKFGKQMGEFEQDVAKAKENSGGTKAEPFVTTKDIQDFIDATFKDGRKTSNHAAVKINSKLIFKAAETFGWASFFDGGTGTVSDAFTGRMVDPTLFQRVRKRNLILDNFQIGTITVPKLIYLIKVEASGAGDSGSNVETGGAEWIVSGAAKPMRSFRVTTGEANAVKIAIFGTVEDKLLRDVPSLEMWLKEDFFDEIREAYNDGLLNNNPAVDPNAPMGLKQNAIQYSVTPAFTGTITNPNYIDVIIAMAAKMADLKEQPGIAFVSSDVYYAMQNLKDTNERYQNNNLVYTNTLGQLFVAGVKVVQADSEDIPSTHVLLVSANPGFKIYNYGPLVFERGLNGEDFREDKTSFRGYQEVVSFIPDHRFNTVMYDTIANVIAAIEV